MIPFPFVYKKTFKVKKGSLSLEEAKGVLIDFLEGKGYEGDITEDRIFFKTGGHRFDAYTTAEILITEIDDSIVVVLWIWNYAYFIMFILFSSCPLLLLINSEPLEMILFLICVLMIILFSMFGINFFPSNFILGYKIKKRLASHKKIIPERGSFHS